MRNVHINIWNFPIKSGVEEVRGRIIIFLSGKVWTIPLKTYTLESRQNSHFDESRNKGGGRSIDSKKGEGERGEGRKR